MHRRAAPIRSYSGMDVSGKELRNIALILEAAGSSIDKVVSATFILRDPVDFEGMNEEWLSSFPTNPPARQGAALPPVDLEGMRISIAVVAEA